MKAFGTFVEETSIDFNLLNKYGLFLITGETGAGKTTILDAITFSLFGEASGDARRSENFKSDYADISELCLVTFEFESRGKKYKVDRYPRQSKKSSTKGKNVTIINSKARLLLPDGTEIEGTDNVNQKIIEILGITYKQFKQIVVLPQGEFKRLLESKSDDKQEIFRKIFDTNIYEQFSLLLCEKTRCIQKQIDGLKFTVNTYISSIDTGNNSDLKKIIDKILFDSSVSVTSNMYVLLPIFNKSLSDDEELVSNIKKQIDEFENKKNDINGDITKINIVIDKKTRLQEAKLKKEKQVKRSQLLQIEFDGELIEISKLTKLKENISNLIDKKNYLNNQLIYLKELEKVSNDIRLLNNNKFDVEKEKERLLLIEKKINMKNQLDEINIVIYNIHSLLNKVDEYNNLCFQYSNKENEYLLSYKKFLTGQAGFLAKNLLIGQSCPVCGSDIHPKKALLMDDTPSEAMVEELLNEVNAIKKELSSLDLKISEIFNYLKDNVIEMSDFHYSQIINQSEELMKIEKIYSLQKNETLKFFNSINIDITNIGVKEIDERVKIENNKIIELKSDIKNSNLKKQEILSKIEDKYNSIEKICEKINYIDEEINMINTEYQSKTDKHSKTKTYLDKCKQEIELLSDEILRLEFQISDEMKNLETLDINELNASIKSINENIKKLREEYIVIMARVKINRQQYENVNNIIERNEDLYKKYSDYASLSEVSSGKNLFRVSFERYILASYFQNVIDAANFRFLPMTSSRYLLKRKEDKEKNNRASGLDLEIIDNYTGKARHINTLSGGESFKASLCLALGLADVIQMNSGGVEIDTLFIDEGFGTLDSESIDSAISALVSLKNDGRIVGIISHVNELKERISAKLIVSASKNGSRVKCCVT